MVKVCVIQTDNRISLDYLLRSQEINKKFCDVLEYDYKFIELNNIYNVDNQMAKFIL